MLVRIDSKKVREARTRALLSKEQLAIKCGVSSSRISKLEGQSTAHLPMQVNTASKICKALGLDPEEVVLEVVGEAPGVSA